MSAERPAAERDGFGLRDAAALALLAAAATATRLPALDRVGLNPDESQYEATAAWLVATGQSAFAVPHTSGGTFALYAWLTEAFGAYPVVAVRVLVLALCLILASMLYALVRRAAGRVAGLVAGLVLVEWSVWFEGLTSNREWYAGPLVLAGVALAVAAGDRGPRARMALLVAGGVACGLSLWFKMQSAPLVLAPGAALAMEAAVTRKPRRAVASLAAFGGGAALGLGAYFAVFAVHGTLGAYWGSIVADVGGYATNRPAAGEEVGPATYVRALLGTVPFRPLMLVAWAYAALVLAAWASRPWRSRPWPWARAGGRTALYLAWYFLGALAAVSLGRRFFGHYFLYVVPPAAGLVALAARDAWDARGVAAGRGLAGVLLAALALERVAALVAIPGPVLGTMLGSPWSVVSWAALALVLGWVIVRPARRAGPGVAAAIGLAVGVLVVATHRAPPPASFPHHPGGFAHLAAEVEDLARPGDRVFVWGWLPELYSLTRLEPSSLYTTTQYVVGDVHAAPVAPRLDPGHAERLMHDLRERPPRIVLDAAARSWTMRAGGDRALYRLDQYRGSDLVTWLERHYGRVGTFDGVGVWVRGEDGRLASPTGFEPVSPP